MEKKIISSFAELEALVGQELGVSDWHTFDQDQINLFADATLDHQWIHVDVEKAKRESTFGNTIAHGYLTLSILPHLWEQIVDVRNVKDQINYGIEHFKFNQPVIVGSRVRLHVKVGSVVDLRGTTKANMTVKLEIEGNRKPAYEGEIVFLYHFNS
ncbi:MAG: MaoC family dehydratase [Bacteroidales bacterium]|nr:MaoC family dehydratase [Bacteroidales bacterium]